MKKIIYSITPFTTIDYKDHLSCIVWFIHCNMQCQYCYNCNIVSAKSGQYMLEDLYSFLKKRVGLLDAVVLSGGEATIHNLLPICKEIKEFGFKIKLDTNGSNPKLLETLLKRNLLDFVSLDFKSTKEKFKDITKSSLYERFISSLKLLTNSSINYEVRTTLHRDLLDEKDINKMQKVLSENGYKKTFYIQNFLEKENFANLEQSSTRFDCSKLDKTLDISFRN
ncbi:anaerobic ribonucleoside-triphosphate reductase activating protein [Halarcobacter sp.]|uniref:anaerobic ribonucleoside-triphosphate reductase activating protein n=1 Tax=Halarcobacter sp. TaxID=2321133 RepID=UPI003B0046A7